MTAAKFPDRRWIMGFWGWAIQIVGLAISLYQLWTW
jgi:hypothetical protein